MNQEPKENVRNDLVGFGSAVSAKDSERSAVRNRKRELTAEGAETYAEVAKKSKLRHYRGLEKTESRLQEILSAGTFQPFVDFVRGTKERSPAMSSGALVAAND